MADSIVYTDLVCEDGVDALMGEDPVLAIMSKSESKEFEQKTYQTGDTVKIRIEDQPLLPVQSSVASMDPVVQTEISLQVLIWNTTFQLGSLEEQYYIGGKDRVREKLTVPRMKTMAVQAALTAYEELFMCPGFFGTAGAALKTSTDWNYGRAALKNQLAGTSGLYAIMSENNMAETAGDLAQKFNPSTDSATAYLEGDVKSAGGLNFFSSSNLPVHTNGSGVASGTSGMAVGVNVTTGATSVTVTGGTATGTFLVGDVIFFSGCYEVQPQTKVTIPRLRTFTVTEDVTLSGGGGVIKVFPAIVGPENPKLQTISALPTTANYVGRKGTASHTYEQCLIMKKNSSSLVSLALPDLVMAKNSVGDYQGIKVYSSMSSDITNRQNIVRADMLIGAKNTQWRHQYRAFTADLG
jgi:hypothetical protein